VSVRVVASSVFYHTVSASTSSKLYEIGRQTDERTDVLQSVMGRAVKEGSVC